MNFAKLASVEKVECKICGTVAHFLEPHLAQVHNISVEDYQAKFGGAPVLSEAARMRLQDIETESRNELIDFDIKKTFGIEVSKRTTTIKGFSKPHKTTPKLDPDYVFRFDQLEAIMFARVRPLQEKVLFVGPTGSGKTSAAEQVAARLNLPFYKISMDLDISRSDFVGQWMLKEQMEFLYGLLATGMKTPYAMVVIDEWDCANPGSAMALQPVLEGGPLTIAETSEIIQPADGVSIFCTANTNGMGDETGLYSGTQVQNFAQLDRFTMVVDVDYPEFKIEKGILEKKCELTKDGFMKRFGVAEFKKGYGPEKIIQNFLEVAQMVREAFVNEEISATMSTRTVINIANKLMTFNSVRKAYKVGYLNKLNSEDREFVSEIIQRKWGV